LNYDGFILISSFVTKSFFNFIKLEFADLFTFNPITVTRDHPYHLFVPFARNNFRKLFLLIVC